MFSAKENCKETIITAQGGGTNMSTCFRQKRIAKRQLSQDGPCTPGSELRWDSPGSDACRLHSINAAYAHHLHHPSLHNHPNPRYPHYHHHHHYLLIYIHTIIFGLTQRTLLVFIILLFIIMLIIIIYWWNHHHYLYVPSLHVSSCWSSSSSLNQKIRRFYFCYSLSFWPPAFLDSGAHHPTKTV